MLVFLFLIVSSLIFITPVLAQQPSPVPVSLIRTIDTSKFSPPSPDPAGITFIPSQNRFLVVDSEVDEMSIFAGKNIFELSANGALVHSYTTLPFSHEPTGIAYDSLTNRFYISDDDQKKVFTINPGPDNNPGTADDTVTNFSTLAFGCTDTEGIAFANNSLYLACGVDKKVFHTTTSGALIDSFDVSKYGIVDFEGVTYNPSSNSLFIMARNPKIILETDLSGNIKRKYDISSLNSKAPADLTFKNNNLFIVDRMVDNNSNPNENDGRIYEISLNSTPSISPPAHTITPTKNPPSPTPCALPSQPLCPSGKIQPSSDPQTPGVCPPKYVCVTYTPTPPAANKPGDANSDNIVDGIDYIIWLNHYNQTATGSANGDFDGSGLVDGVDYVIWLNNYNK